MPVLLTAKKIYRLIGKINEKNKNISDYSHSVIYNKRIF